MTKKKEDSQQARKTKGSAGKVIAGRLIHKETTAPVFPALIEAYHHQDPISGMLGRAKVDRRGAFTMTIDKRRKVASREIVLYVFDGEHTRVLSAEPTIVRLGSRQARKIIIEVHLPTESEPLSDDIEELRKGLGLKMPRSLVDYLERSGIKTLAGIRQRGGLSQDPELPVPADQAAVRMLDSLAALSLLPTDIRTNAALASSGLGNVLDVANATPESIEKALAAEPSMIPHTQIHAIAQDQARALSNMIFESQVDAAFGERAHLSKAFLDALPQTCGCSECQNAMGPIAYLADLLDYTIRHVRNNGQSVTLTFLQERFHQPFRDLPVSCAELDRRVRRVRICIEILRRHLAGRAPTRYPEILEAAYRTLLENIGTSYEEVRQLSRHGKQQLRDDLMTRLMLPATVTLDPLIFQATVTIDALFRDPNAPAGDPMAISEEWLNEIFGLRNTTLEPLAEAREPGREPGAEVPERYPHLLRWQRRFLWDQWRNEDYAPQLATLDGRPFIDPDVIGLPDLKDVTSNPTPRALRPDRTRWSVLDFLEDRQYWINTTITELRTALAGPPAGLRARLTNLLQRLPTSFPRVGRITGMEGLTFDVIWDLYLQQQNGANLNDQLEQLNITANELDGLGRVLDLAVAGDPILTSEWDDFYSIIIGCLKRFGFHASWKNEERQMSVVIDLEPLPLTGLTLSPHHFQMRSASALGANTEWRATPWRSTNADRGRWEEVLQTRIDRAQNLVAVLQGAVEEAEVVELPEIRNLLLRIAQPPGVLLTDSTKRLTDRYQIDFEEGACAWTTRIAQATQTLQGILFGARNGLLDDPALTLDDDNFDNIWPWIGSFPPWKSAMLIYMYPAVALRPTLRSPERQSQGFVEFISSLRSAGKVTLASAKTAVAVYEQYFVDICSLDDGVCVLAPAPGPASSEFFNYLFARSSSGRLYWCYFDLNDEQSHWHRLELPLFDESQGELKLFGAAYLTGRDGECYLYFFGKQSGLEEDRIIFGRTNVREGTNWSELRWSAHALKGLPKPAAAPEAATRFEFAKVLIDRVPSDPIKLSVWLSERDAYVRALNMTGLAWEDADFTTVPLTGAWRRLGTGAVRNAADFACNTQTDPRQIPVQFMLAGDFDRDGQDEIAIFPTGPLGAGIWVMKFDAASQQWRHLSPAPNDPTNADITDIGSFRFALTGDFDGDGYPEIATAPNLAGPSLGDDDNVGFRVRKFDPSTGTWRPLGRSEPRDPFVEFRSTSWHDPSLTSRFAVAGDFDNDGRDEIAVAVTPIKFVEFPIKYCSNAFMIFDLELRAGGDHIWRPLRDQDGNDALLCDGKVDSPFFHDYDSRFSRFAITGKFRGGNGPTLLVVGKMKLDSAGNDEDRNLGNDFWVYRLEGRTWIREGDLDCANVAVAAKFGLTGDFDGDGVPEAAIMQEALLPGSNEYGFWIEKMDSGGGWNPMPELSYGDRLAVYAVAGDFDGDGADEIAVVTSAIWTSNVRVFDFNNGAWSPLASTNANLLTAGVFSAPGPILSRMNTAVPARLLSGDNGDQLVALTQPDTDNTCRAYAFATTITGSWSTPCSEPEVKPALSVASPILVEPDLEVARQLNARVPAALGSLQRRSNRDYMDELLFFVQLELANRLRESGLYRDALDRCRLVYDYGTRLNERVISAKLRAGRTLSASMYQQWLADTLDPHAIAETRENTYLKYTILLICHCLIDWADAEFARANPESVPKARELYERALDLLNLPEIRQRTDECAELLDVLTKMIGEGELAFPYEQVFREIKTVTDPALLATLTQTITTIRQSGLPLQRKIEQSLSMVRSAVALHDAPIRTFDDLGQDASLRLSSMGRLLAADPDRLSALVALAGESWLDRGDRKFGKVQFIPRPMLSFCVPPNPAVARLRQHAELCLRKIRECKNIAGLELCLDPYAATTSDLTITDSGQPPVTFATGVQPLPYPYVTLIERTKQLVELARQLESSMLQFISSAEETSYEEVKARQDLELTQAGVQLKQLRVVQASDAVGSATMQRDRAQLQASHFTDLLVNGWTVNEQLQVTNLAVAAAHQHAAAIASWVGIWFNQSNYATAISTSGSAWAQNSQFHGLLASFERRNQEWQFEKRVAEQDVRIGQQEIIVAKDDLVIAAQEQAIAALQADHAQTVVNFLAGKFLNADLYEWMADVLEQVYRFFLQQATQLARLAELQLSFERQEPPASIIKADYWERPSADLTPDVGASSAGTNNVRGLTGSARLLRDVFELDQYAFAKNQRKQQLSETFSLAQLDPFAFQVFRQTGRLPFATPMSLFDRGFPGHYLRLIKRVRTSVVALIPPTMGIRAMLSSIGPTRVIVGPEVFHSATIRREPQLVALTSPANATGLFDLDAQPELLVPFEGLGVEGNWVFDMPKASNPFDYDAIADVLVTFDYTALYSPDYQVEILKTMDRSFRADRAFSFRQEFADAWYDLNNPEIIDDPDVPMTVSFKTRRVDFPPNIKQLVIEQVLMHFLQRPGPQQAVDIEEFFFVTDSGQAVPGSVASRAATSTSEGLFSTRRGAWSAFAGSAIDGDLTWTLKLPDALKSRFKNQEITDIFLVISYRGLLEYPV